MRCPYCSHDISDVKDSRVSDDGKTTKRRRQCQHCKGRFNTFERIELRELMVVKRNSGIEPFQRDKITRSVSLACRKRNISDEKIEAVISIIVDELEKAGEASLSTSMIGGWVMKKLALLDKVAFVRYASVYKEFDSVKDFEHFIEHEIEGSHETTTIKTPDQDGNITDEKIHKPKLKT